MRLRALFTFLLVHFGLVIYAQSSDTEAKLPKQIFNYVSQMPSQA